MNNISKNELRDAFRADLLHLIILPTEKCNFRCTYCYEDFEYGRMSDSVVDGIMNLVRIRFESGLRHLNIGWFGGEPLLAKDIIRTIAESSCHAARSCGGSVHGGFTTNGSLLTSADIDAFARVNHYAYQITLDGEPDIHNALRRFSGGDSFSTVWKALDALSDSEHDVQVTIRIHVSKDGASSIPRLVDRINRSFAGDGRFSVHFHRLSDLGGGAKEQVLSEESYRNILPKLKSELLLRCNSEIDIVNEGGICYAAKPNSFVIRSDGSIAKCTVSLGSPHNNVGQLMADGSIKFNDSSLQRWFYGYRDLKPDMLSCPNSTMDDLPLTRPVKVVRRIYENQSASI